MSVSLFPISMKHDQDHHHDLKLGGDREKMKPQIVLDTSFLLGVAERPFNVSSELMRMFSQGHECYTVPAVMNELQRLKGLPNKEKRKFLFAMKLLEALNTDILPVEQFISTKADDQIIESVKLLEFPVVATMDKEIKRTLNKVGIPIISIRERSHLIVVGYVEQ